MKTMKCFMMLLCATLLFASCKDDEETVIRVNGVTISKTTLSLVEGGSETLTVTITPTDAANANVAWSSDKPTIATVDAEGKVTAVAIGTATITATTADGGKTAICAVTVTPAPIAVTGITLTKSKLSLGTGFKETLTATIAPANATNQTVTWTSDKPTIATVDPATGEVTALATGNAVITVTTTDGNKTATCALTVTPTFANEAKTGIDGSSWEKAYEIATKEQFVLLADRVNKPREAYWSTKYYKLTTDIDFGNGDTKPWTGIGGNKETLFSSHFDGGNHSIKGTLIFDQYSYTHGIFGTTVKAEIKNLHFKGVFDTSKIEEISFPFGGIVAELDGGTVINCTNTAAIGNTFIRTGGIVGKSLNYGKVIACVNSGNINNTKPGGESYLGGIVGDASSGYVIGCINRGNVNNISIAAGGIAGVGSVTSCWSTATSVIAKTYKGGISGISSSFIRAKSAACFWEETAGSSASGEGFIINSASFSGSKPEGAQIAAMNAEWATAQPTGREYQFNATTGEIEKITK